MIAHLLSTSLGVMQLCFAADMPFKFSFELENTKQHETLDLKALYKLQNKRQVDTKTCDVYFDYISPVTFWSHEDISKDDAYANLAEEFAEEFAIGFFWDFNRIIADSLCKLCKEETADLVYFNALSIHTCRYDLIADYWENQEIDHSMLKNSLLFYYANGNYDEKLYELIDRYVSYVDNKGGSASSLLLKILSGKDFNFEHVSKSVFDFVKKIDNTARIFEDINQRNSYGVCYLANLYANPDFDFYDETLSIKLWKIAAQDGNVPQAQYELGKLYESNKLSSSASDAPLKWYLQSASNGYAPALRKLAEFYTDSNDLKLAEKFHIEAAIQSNGKEIDSLIAFYNQYPSKNSIEEIAIWTLRKQGQCYERAQQGDPIDQYFMAYHLASHTSDSSKIKDQIISLLEKSTMQGFIPAQRALYLCTYEASDIPIGIYLIVDNILMRGNDANICDSFWRQESLEMKAFMHYVFSARVIKNIIPLMVQNDLAFLLSTHNMFPVVRTPCKNLKANDMSKFITEYVIPDDIKRLSIDERLKESTNHQISCFLEKTKKSAESGDILSMYAYARMISEQKDDMTTIKEALKWYRKAGEYGHNRAMYEISVLLDEYPELREDNETSEQYRSQYVNPRRFKGNDQYE